MASELPVQPSTKQQQQQPQPQQQQQQPQPQSPQPSELNIKNVFGKTTVQIINGKGTFLYLNEWHWRGMPWNQGQIIGLCSYGETKIGKVRNKYKLKQPFWTIFVELKVHAPIIREEEKKKIENDMRFRLFRQIYSPQFKEIECVYS